MALSLRLSALQTSSVASPPALHRSHGELFQSVSRLGPLSSPSLCALRFAKRTEKQCLRRKPGVATVRMEFGEFEPAEETFEYVDDEFVRVSVIEATSVSSTGDALLVGMTDGVVFKCAHNLMAGVRLPEYPAQPAAVLKLEDGSRILLPILVPQLACQMLIDSVRGVPLTRPTVYAFMRDMIDRMGYEMTLIRITHRQGDAYCARVYIVQKGGSDAPPMSFDMRPSDAINLAARAHVPIQVRRSLAVADGVRIVGTTRQTTAGAAGHSAGHSSHNAHGKLLRRHAHGKVALTSDDRPDLSDVQLADEFALLRLMEEAARDERYTDAAKIRDQLTRLRRKEHTV
eukprot:TRINITY_DN3955_c0_g1_i2.p1 TRINITY_DN3955_c0_g1~~TRINITY_DN3955_c0_g1_i2.p1  ORF type:complete len:344 (+),score=-8.91 TRINITY_DN3955_c0_g1_i2:237-1268(+)